MRKKLLLPFTHWRKAQHVLLLLVGLLGVMLPTSAQTLVYSNAFSSQSDFNTMTVLDANGDNSTWSYNNGGYAQYTYNSNNAANDWLFTPGITLEAGKTYQFVIDAWARSTSYIERLEVKMGTAPTAAGMTTSVIASTNITSTSAVTLTNNSVTVATTGTYYFGIHAISDKDRWQLYVDNLVITDLTPAVPKPTDLTVSNVTHNSATASWTGNNDAQSYNLRYRKRVPSWNFEDAAQFNEFIIIDNDGDNYNWKYYNNAGLTQGIMAAHGGDGLIISESYDNDAGLALSPDNWLISQVIDLGGTLTFWAAGQDSNYPAEKFGLFVCTSNSTNPADFTQVDTDKTATATYTKYSFDLSQYAGQTGRFAIVHHNVSDMFILKVDDIEITGMSDSEWTIVNGLTASQYNIEGLAHSTQYEVQVQAVYADGTSNWTSSVNFTTLSALTLPENLVVSEITSATAQAGWQGIQDSYNLRYREVVDIAHLNRFWDFEDTDQLIDWNIIDADGDNNNWEYNTGTENGDAATQSYVLTSYSWLSGVGALTPDNWLITPEVALGGTLTFDAWGQDPQYPAEPFAVYVGNATATQPADFTQVLGRTVATANRTTYTVDLSQYAGQTGRIAFRHYDVTDVFRLNLDNVRVTVPGGVDQPDWTTISDVTSPYTMTGLTPETNYEVQVQGIYDSGTTNWTNSEYFTTLEAVSRPMTLAALVADGEVGIRYTISEPLLAVYGVGNKLWLKDDNKYATKATPAEGDQNYEIILQGNPHENQADYDQSNWIEVQLADGSEAVENLVGTIIKADKITGTFSNKTNPTMTGVTLVEGDYELTSGDGYVLNYYCTANFVGPQNGTIAGETYHFFFMTPKPQEYAKVVWAKYDAASGKMIMPSEGNGHGFHGEFEVDLSLNSGTSPEDGKTYNFEAIVRRIESTGGNTLRANKSNDYIVYPLNLSDEVVTGINNVTGKTVAGVKYYNLAGMESDRPFEGVNIIVTTYTDGSRSSAKVLK